MAPGGFRSGGGTDGTSQSVKSVMEFSRRTDPKLEGCSAVGSAENGYSRPHTRLHGMTREQKGPKTLALFEQKHDFILKIDQGTSAVD